MSKSEQPTNKLLCENCGLEVNYKRLCFYCEHNNITVVPKHKDYT